MSESKARRLRLVGITELSCWFAGLGYSLARIWPILSHTQTGDWASFALVAFVFGAFGGLIQAVIEYSDYVLRSEWGALYPVAVEFDASSKPTRCEAVPETRHFAFCVVLPLMRPLLGSGTGFALAAVIQDVGVHPGRVALVSLVGGYFTQSLMRSLGKSFGLGGPP